MHPKSHSFVYTLSLLLIVILDVLTGYFSVYSDAAITVSAIVGSGNNPPEILLVTPDTSPFVISKNSLQTFSLQIQDIDSPSVSYTITASSGSTAPINGTISNTSLLSSGNAYINFTYYAPPAKAGLSSITVTVNDGSNVIVRNIALYVY